MHSLFALDRLLNNAKLLGVTKRQILATSFWPLLQLQLTNFTSQIFGSSTIKALAFFTTILALFDFQAVLMTKIVASASLVHVDQIQSWIFSSRLAIFPSVRKINEAYIS